jgi:hypothetical protein
VAAGLHGRVGGRRKWSSPEGLRHETSLKMKREEERMERELMEKAAGDHGLCNLARGSAWQMEGAPTPYQTRRVVRAVTGPLDRKV